VAQEGGGRTKDFRPALFLRDKVSLTKGKKGRWRAPGGGNVLLLRSQQEGERKKGGGGGEYADP